jgi:hypothetical protein
MRSSNRRTPMKLSHRHSGARGRRAHLAFALAAPFALLLPSVASAQQVVVVQGATAPAQSEARVEYAGPNWGLLGSGLAVFSGTYIASIVVAGTSSHGGDKDLYIPFVGPWIDMANRCPTTCVGDTGNKVLLGFDGVFQGIAAIAIVSSFFVPERRSSLSRRASATTFHFAPASYGRGAPGLTMVGTF